MNGINKKKIEAFPMPALRIATKPIEEASKVASVYPKATKSQTPKTLSTPPKKSTSRLHTEFHGPVKWGQRGRREMS